MTDDEEPRARRPSLAQRAAQALHRHPGEMPGPFGRSFWRSPIRGPWLTSVLGLVLLAGVSVAFVTGLLSYAAYNPDLNRVNDETHGKGLLGFYLFSWPTHPVWLYRLNQGVHVTLGLVLIPILLAKLWSVLPRLFEWPPLRSPAHALERPRPAADAAVLAGRPVGHGRGQAPRAAAARDSVDQLRAGARRAVRLAAPGVVPADPAAAVPLPRVDHIVGRSICVALARGDGRAVPAVRRRIRGTAAPPVAKRPAAGTAGHGTRRHQPWS